MLRRPPTTLTLTAEDVAAYEDRRFAAMQAQSENQAPTRASSHPLQQQSTAMDTSSSSLTPSPPQAEDDEDMQDVDVDEEDEEEEEADADEADTSDPFITAPRRAAREQFNRREQSPGQARAAYLQQVRASRNQHATPTAPASSTRTQRITGAGASTAQSTRTTTRSATSRQGSTEPTNAAAPPPAPARMMTRSREERIGITGSTTGTGSRRR
ncbi:uncharacterized protein F4812DRAFT_438572 [Daldinia caldariorum]|uniref:uncharacterized protein n=1 Tax=Daldinia caldariorum TaxID=326644 RepID=UPI0020083580|nr:uncharacterized protein F4812DRAFT_438572 [Daldinia caldariorum]KAI1465403.1 hypothetical protein F4812DRAFT_438572 [Daldinia caldariorum]